MSLAYYLEFDPEDLDVESVDGKSVARAIDKLNTMAEALDLKPLEAFLGQAIGNVGDMLDDDMDLPDGEDGVAVWFEPADGLATIQGLTAALRADPTLVKRSDDVLEDLQGFQSALETAAKSGAKWHLAIDF